MFSSLNIRSDVLYSVHASYGENLLYTFPCVSLCDTKKTGAKAAGFVPAQRYTPCTEPSQPPDSLGHTPRKLPAHAAISRIIAVRLFTGAPLLYWILCRKSRGFLIFFVRFLPIPGHIPPLSFVQLRKRDGMALSVSKSFDTLLKNAGIFEKGYRPPHALADARTLAA